MEVRSAWDLPLWVLFDFQLEKFWNIPAMLEEEGHRLYGPEALDPGGDGELIDDWIAISWLLLYYNRLDELECVGPLKPPIRRLKRKARTMAEAVAPVLGWADPEALQAYLMKVLTYFAFQVEADLITWTDRYWEDEKLAGDTPRRFEQTVARLLEDVLLDMIEVKDRDGKLKFIIVPPVDGREYLAVRADAQDQSQMAIEAARVDRDTVLEFRRGELDAEDLEKEVFDPENVFRMPLPAGAIRHRTAKVGAKTLLRLTRELPELWQSAPSAKRGRPKRKQGGKGIGPKRGRGRNRLPGGYVALGHKSETKPSRAEGEKAD